MEGMVDSSSTNQMISAELRIIQERREQAVKAVDHEEQKLRNIDKNIGNQNVLIHQITEKVSDTYSTLHYNVYNQQSIYNEHQHLTPAVQDAYSSLMNIHTEFEQNETEIKELENVFIGCNHNLDLALIKYEAIVTALNKQTKQLLEAEQTEETIHKKKILEMDEEIAQNQKHVVEQMIELEQYKCNLLEMTQLNDTYETQKMELQSELQKRQVEAVELDNQKVVIENSSKNKSLSYQKQIEELTPVCEEKDKKLKDERDQLNNQHQLLEEQSNQIASQQFQIAELEQQKTILNQGIARDEATLANKKKHLAHVYENIAKELNVENYIDNSESRTELKEAIHTELIRLEVENENFKKAYEEMKTEMHRMDEKAAELKEETRNILQETKENISRIQLNHAKLEELQQKYDTTAIENSQKMDAVKLKLEKSHNEIETLKAEMANTEADYQKEDEELSKQIDILDKEIEKLNKEREARSADYETLDTELCSYETKCDDITYEIRKLQRRLMESKKPVKDVTKRTGGILTAKKWNWDRDSNSSEDTSFDDWLRLKQNKLSKKKDN